ncbi:calpain small subunit 2-like [Rhinophrynus dorsalis]
MTIAMSVYWDLRSQDDAGRINADHLGLALQRAGLQVDDLLVRLAQLRYSDNDDSITYSSFICCLLKLQSVTGMFHAADPTGSGTVTLNYHQWLQLALYS